MPSPPTLATLTQRILPGVPTPALFYGLAGLIPFVYFATNAHLAAGPASAAAQIALRGYGIAILSFLGGVHWGLALASSDGEDRPGVTAVTLGFSVAPSVFAWACLALPLGLGLGYLAVCFIIFYAVERPRLRAALSPKWYGSLRLVLTSLAAICLAAGAIA